MIKAFPNLINFLNFDMDRKTFLKQFFPFALIALIVVSTVLFLYFSVQSRLSKLNVDIRAGIANTSQTGFEIYIINKTSSLDDANQHFSLSSLLHNKFAKNFIFWKLDNEEMMDCSKLITESENRTPCYSIAKEEEGYSLMKFSNFLPGKTYTISLYNKASKKDIFTGTVTTYVEPKSAFIPHRIYGQVVDQNGKGIGEALVLIKPSLIKAITTDLSTKVPTLVTVTEENGTYSTEYPISIDENFLQEVEVFTKQGATSLIDTASFENKPVKNAVVSLSEEDLKKNTENALVLNAYAADNSCFTEGMGGIRVQCDLSIHWMTEINPNNCPDPTKIKVGLIRHTSYTHFYPPDDPSKTLLTIKDKSGTVILDKIPNGNFFYTSRLKAGETYTVEAYLNGVKCTNTDGKPITITMSPKTNEYEPVSDKISAGSKAPNMCKKIGENSAWEYDLGSDYLSKISDSNMSWIEGIVTEIGRMDRFKKTVVDAKNQNITAIMRLCYQGNCKIYDGKAYGDAVVKLYTELVQEGQLPGNGLFVHIGHNDVNTAELIDPQTEAKFMIEAIKSIDEAGLLSTNPKSNTIKVISPNFDLFNNDNYKAVDYIDKMIAYQGFSESAKKIYAWAANDYIRERSGGVSNVADDLSKFSAYLKGKNFNGNVMATEFGSFMTTGAIDLNTLKTQLETMDKDPNIVAILLFNSFKANPAFNHFEGVNISDLIANCSKGAFVVPQEGAGPVIDNHPIYNPTQGTSSAVPVTPSSPTTKKATGEEANLLASNVTNNESEKVLGESSLLLSEIGEYSLKSPEYTVLVDSVARYESESGEVSFFNDENRNGTKDEGEIAVPSASFTAEKIGEITRLELKKGTNIISVPIYSQNALNSLSIWRSALDQGISVYSVGYLDQETNKWKVYNVRGYQQYSKPFDIPMGKGVLLAVESDSNLVLSGSVLEPTTLDSLVKGWNLLSLPRSAFTKDPSAREIVDYYKSKGRTVNAISTYNPVSKKFESFVVEEDGNYYGENFQLDLREGIFVRQTN